MLIVDPPVQREKSELPPGGTPADDKAYLAWREGWLVRIADLATLRRIDLPIDALAAWRFDAFLFARLDTLSLLVETTYSHRLRALAVAHRTRLRDVTRLAQRFADEALRHDGC